MRAMTISELLQLTKIEILDLRSWLHEQLPRLPLGSAERHDTLETLENIRIVLSRPEFRRVRRPALGFTLER